MADDDHIDDALASELTLLVDGRLPDDRRAASSRFCVLPAS